MRIGIIAGEYPPHQGGVGAYTRIIALRLIELGHSVSILCGNDAIEPDDRIHLQNSITSWNILSLRQISRWATAEKLDIINIQFETAAFGMSPWVHFIPRITSVPVVTTFHDLLVPYLFPKAGALRQWITRYLAQKSNGIILTNQEDYAQTNAIKMRKLIPIGSNISTTLPADFDRSRWRETMGVNSDDFLMAHFGFMNRTKGIEILLEDMAVIRQHYQYPLKLVMIGGKTGYSDPSNADYADEIDSKIQRLQLEDSIIWTGYVDDTEVSAHLIASDVVVLPFKDGASYRRGSLMAAIHHGCAIITTAPRVYVPTFVDEENMLLARALILDESIPPYTHVSQEILLLYRNPELREKLRHGASKLAGHFDWKGIAKKYVDFFNVVLGVQS
ncbi:MAG: glycosyltransferase family 4 protein [Aggregatilineales bacterium]